MKGAGSMPDGAPVGKGYLRRTFGFDSCSVIGLAVLCHQPGTAHLAGVRQDFGVRVGLDRLAHPASLPFMRQLAA